MSKIKFIFLAIIGLFCFSIEWIPWYSKCVPVSNQKHVFPSVNNSNSNLQKFKNLNSFDPTYTSINYPNTYSGDTGWVDSGNSNTFVLENSTINITDYAANINDFFDKYSVSIKIQNANLNYFDNYTGLNDSKSIADRLFTFSGKNMLGKQTLFSFFDSGYKNREFSIYLNFNLSINGDFLDWNVTGYAYCHKGQGNGWKKEKANCYLNAKLEYLSFDSNFSSYDCKKKIADATNLLPFEFITHTSSSISSTMTQDILDDKIVQSNRIIIISEFENRIKAIENYSEWKDRVNIDDDYINSNIVFDDTENEVYLTCTNKNDYSFVGNVFPDKLEMNVKLNFDQQKIQKKVKDAFSTIYSFNSNYSPNITNKEINMDIDDDEGHFSNYQKIENEISRRIKTIFSNNYDNWKEFINVSGEQYDDSSSSVKLTFNGKFVDLKQWPENITLNCKITLTKKYWSRTLAKRLTISPSKIMDISKSDGGMVNDRPSYDSSTKTYTYHSAVNLTFTTQYDSSTKNTEELKVAGANVSVKNNVFRTTLIDKRQAITNSEEAKNATKYQVEVLSADKDSSKSLKFNIVIDSVSNSLKFKWKNWDPENNEKQKLLITEQIPNKDGTGNIPNPKYNEKLNKDTGTLDNFIFVKENNLDNSHPFAIDPLDSNGQKISDITNKNKPNYGYIAQATVVNSGVYNLTDGLKNIDHVDRVELDPKTLKAKGAFETININEAQFSQTGLWRYIIYQKNWVSKVVDPSEQYDGDVEAVEGSVINKLLYITKEDADSDSDNIGKDFTALAMFRDNEFISSFWNSIEGIHLKNYLTSTDSISFTSENIAKLNYEQIISYWYIYVSNAIENIAPTPKKILDISLQDEISTIKMNECDEEKAKQIILSKIKNYVQTFSSDSIYNSDYFITDEFNSKIKLEKVDLSDFANINKNVPKKQITLYVKATDTSTKLIGYKKFTIINSKKFDPDKMENLSNVILPKLRYNFSNYKSGDFKKEYIKKYFENVLSENMPDGMQFSFEYQKDYLISANGYKGRDYKDDTDFDNNLETFIKNDGSKLILTIYATDNSTTTQGSTCQTYINDCKAPLPPEIKTDIGTIFKKLDLGEIDDVDKNGYISKEIIWKKIVSLNNASSYKNLNINGFSFSVQTIKNNNFSAIINAKDENEFYKGSVVANYNSKFSPEPDLTKTDIGTIFKKLDLGEIDDVDKNGYISKEIIWKKIVSLNNASSYKNLNINGFDILISAADINKYKVSIIAKPNNQFFKGSVVANYNSKFSPEPDPNPEPPSPDKKKKINITKKTAVWIIPVMIFSSSLMIFCIWWYQRRRKTKGKKKRKNKQQNKENK